MTGRLIYPPADHTTQWVGKGSVLMPMDHVKWVVHTTETAGGWPAYDKGGTMGSAPTLTYEPWQHRWRQHFEINQSARALPNGPQDQKCNRVDVVQVEISCYCDAGLSGKYGHAASKIDQQAIDDLGAFGVFLHEDWGMDLDFYPETLPWPAYPRGTVRMGWDRYVGYSGVLGHMAVPYSVHLDPGNLPLDRIAGVMRGDARDPWPHLGDHSAAVATIQRRLALARYYHGRDPDSTYGQFTRGAIRRLQLAQGWSGSGADGLIGEQTWKVLQGLPDAPKEPPVDPPEHQTLLDVWQHATGTVRRAQGAALAAGTALVKAQPNRPTLRAVLERQEARDVAEAADWEILHDAANP